MIMRDERAPSTNGLMPTNSVAAPKAVTEGEDDVPYCPSPDLPGDEYFERSCNEPQLGMKVSGVEIVEILPGGWGDVSGLELDDEIFSVNDVAFLPLKDGERMKLMKSKRPLQIKFKRPMVKDGYFRVTMLEDEGPQMGAR